VSFGWHAFRRAFYIQRLMRRFVGFEEMLVRLYPLDANAVPPVAVPEDSVLRVAESCAYLFPGLWHRRCLFRSLLVLDWAHRIGIDPTLNIGMELGLAREQGHCWLSLGERAFCEPGGWPRRYRTLFYRASGLQHWTSLAPDDLGDRPVTN